MFDLFDFTPVDYDPFAKQKGPGPPMPPVRPNHDLPTPMIPGPMMPRNDLWGDPHFQSPDNALQMGTPLPSWIPQNVQDYMHKTPSYAEGERQTQAPSSIAGVPSIAGGTEPYSPTPQIDDIKRLFQRRMMANSPVSGMMSAKQLHDLMQLPGFSGFTGGDEI